MVTNRKENPVFPLKVFMNNRLFISVEISLNLVIQCKNGLYTTGECDQNVKK